jgi:APA family basic amino acid/polyamine antiporter
MYPKAGGNYVFLKEAYGPMWGFLYGWAYTLVTSGGTVALLALGFAEYLGIAKGTFASKGFSIVVIVILTLLNTRGVKVGAGVMDFITSIKIFAMVILVGLGFTLGHGEAGRFTPLFTGEAQPIIFAIASALVPMAFTYSGWNSTVFVAEEVKNPGRLLPMSLVLGTLATTAIYMAMNAVYLYAVPLDQLVGETRIAHLAAANLFNPQASRLIQVLVATSVLGCLSATLLTNPRTLFALGRDGLFFRFTAAVHPKYGTPNGAILFQGLWACLLILIIGDFDRMLAFVSVPLVIIGTMTVFSIFVFRWKRPDAERPYRCWGYPLVPALYVILSCFMLYAKILQRGIYGPIGIGIFVVGVPVYYLWVRAYARFGAAPTARG